jgi:tetratricopeptide (TPR) repeat protein
VLDLLQGLPLALTQAGTYMRETNTSALKYVEHYNQTWSRLMNNQDKFPLEEYDRSVMTTWTISFDQVQRQSEEAACLLKLWGFLDNGEVWYELFAPGQELMNGVNIPRWLQTITEDAPTFAATMGLLSHFSLAEGREGPDSHSMHSVLHKWCSVLTNDNEQPELVRLAAGFVASQVPVVSEVDYWTKQKRIIAHGLCVYQWIEKVGELVGKESVLPSVVPSHFHALGYLFHQNYMQQAEQMYLRALHGYEKAQGPDTMSTYYIVNNLGTLYRRLNRLDDAEQMLQRALDGKEKIFGLEHIDTLGTVNSLGLLYRQVGRPEEAEQMLQRALDGIEKISGSDDLDTLTVVNNLGLTYMDIGRLDDAEQMLQRAQAGYTKLFGISDLRTNAEALVNSRAFVELRWKQGRIDEARHGWSQALLGHEKLFGPDHKSCRDLRNNLAVIAQFEEKKGSSSKVEEVEDKLIDANDGTSQKRSAIAIREAVEEHSLEERDIAVSSESPQENREIVLHNSPKKIAATSGQKPVSFRRRLVAKLTRK